MNALLSYVVRSFNNTIVYPYFIRAQAYATGIALVSGLATGIFAANKTKNFLNTYRGTAQLPEPAKASKELQNKKISIGVGCATALITGKIAYELIFACCAYEYTAYSCLSFVASVIVRL